MINNFLKDKNKYNHLDNDRKWQKVWDDNKIYKTENNPKKTKYYILDMFPYPSGAGLHVGHPKGYIATDIISRMKKMRGFDILHPMGWDAFGLPAENYAIKTKTHPKKSTDQNILYFKKQLHKLGLNYDWSREINTTDPKFYKWTQWIFLKLLDKGLAYESYEPINWCPKCQTGLSNEDLEGGVCERCGSEIEKKPMRQWMLKITDYADRLLKDLEELDEWETSIKEMQKNWIGRKEGINIDYPIVGSKEIITCFTTRPDTNFGATFIVIGPEHPFIKKNINLLNNREKILEYIKLSLKKSQIDRTNKNKEKTGVFTGLYCLNRLNNKKLPIWISDYVLGDVGTGAVIGVPGHDKRDFEFAQKFNIPIIRVVVGKDGDKNPIINIDQVQENDGIIINSDFLNGMNVHRAIPRIMDFFEEKKWGKRTVSYKLKDWVFSRQRYWGEPIPVIHCKKCGVVPVPEDQLPVLLPEVDHYEPSGNGESPLANIIDWVNTSCPRCGGKAKRETNTMPQWAGSSWYYLRFLDPDNDQMLVDKEIEKHWSPVDLYVGGAEHATRHLIYSRFWHKFLYDLGVVSFEEPFKKLQHVGLIMAEDGRKMSKRWKNVINPDLIVKKYGADTLRIYEMFMSPFNQSCDWSENGLIGVRKFIDRVWRLKTYLNNKTSKELEGLLQQTIAKVTFDIESFKLNTAISAMMIFVNKATSLQTINTEQFKKFLKILAPFAPYMSEELWQELFSKDGEYISIHSLNWPDFDEKFLVLDVIPFVVQINGKKKLEIFVNSNDALDQQIIVDKYLSNNSALNKLLSNRKIKKIIFVSQKLINYVI